MVLRRVRRAGRVPALALGVIGAVAVPVLAACDVSRVPAAATVHVTGRALDAAGHPLAGTRVQLFKEADLGEAVFGVVFAVGTLGAVCFTPFAPSICRSARVATTAADGTFSYDLSGSDTQGSVGQASTLDVTVADPGRGERASSTTLRFEAQSTGVSLPDARLWDAGLRLGEPRGRFHLDWQALPAADGRDVAYSVELADSERRGLWSQPASGTGADVDARVVEDVRTTAAAQATAALGDTGEVRAVYLSGRVEVAPTAGAPPSRGRPCAAVDASDLSTTPQGRCGLTDSNLVDAARLQGAQGRVVSGAVVDLGAQRPIGVVVVRGLAGGYLVETSSDGRSFTTRATGTDGVAALDLHGAVGRYLRVRSPAGLDESLMTEVSAW